VPKYLIKTYADAANIQVLRKKLEAVGITFDEVTLSKVNQTPNKTETLNQATDLVEEAKGIVEDLISDVDEALENMPENLKNSERAVNLAEAKDELENQLANIEQVDLSAVSF
jgi:plasmid maintenance system antidote protein VapI